MQVSNNIKWQRNKRIQKIEKDERNKTKHSYSIEPANKDIPLYPNGI